MYVGLSVHILMHFHAEFKYGNEMLISIAVIRSVYNLSSRPYIMLVDTSVNVVFSKFKICLSGL